jgi:galactoside O-acetyltransferase
MGRLSQADIVTMGFAHVGENVRISDKASFYGASHISIGDNSRIDDFCVISAGQGGVSIGCNVHIAVFTSLVGGGSITISDFCNLSSRVSVYSSSDDYSGSFMTNPTLPTQFTGVTHAPVSFEKHVIVGCGSVILPGVVLEQGVAVGALSLVNRNCLAFGIYAGVPARRIAERKRDLLDLERKFLESIALD